MNLFRKLLIFSKVFTPISSYIHATVTRISIFAKSTSTILVLIDDNFLSKERNKVEGFSFLYRNVYPTSSVACPLS